ncbi:hypothetical protein GCM10010149_88290 [Nonomuraea roseoviolacea subsp. roseoviolacea]|uniref:hypothetical protein n=1 Tax=Nonomuraea roseoviolacea TaxID=103837 RepID=UPI0031E16E10
MQSTKNPSEALPERYKALVAEVRRVGSIEKASNALHMTRREVQEAIRDTEGLWSALAEAVRDYRDTKSAAIIASMKRGKSFAHACIAETISQTTVETWAGTRPELWAAIEEDTQRLRESLHEKIGGRL